jgi:hypothetical protein
MTHAMPIAHTLKIDPQQLAAIIAGTKTHEVRVFDRDLHVAQLLQLMAFDRKRSEYTGQWAEVKITDITEPGTYGLPATVGVMSIVLTRSFLTELLTGNTSE